MVVVMVGSDNSSSAFAHVTPNSAVVLVQTSYTLIMFGYRSILSLESVFNHRFSHHNSVIEVTRCHHSRMCVMKHNWSATKQCHCTIPLGCYYLPWQVLF